MKIMLDVSPDKIARYSDRYDFEFWQLRTPLTGNKIGNVPYGLDNGCYSEFRVNTWRRMIREGFDNPPVFACMPDIVGDARRTMDLFNYWHMRCYGVPIALVIQDGIGSVPIDWNLVDAVFVGGSDAFKCSKEAANVCKSAKMLDKWVHVGRVNTPERVRHWLGIADSIDGSGISRFDHMLEAILHILKNEDHQRDMFTG